MGAAMKHVILDIQSGHYDDAVAYMARGIMGTTTLNAERYLLCPMNRLPPAFSALLPLMKPYDDGGAFVGNRAFDSTSDAALIDAFVGNENWQSLL